MVRYYQAVDKRSRAKTIGFPGGYRGRATKASFIRAASLAHIAFIRRKEVQLCYAALSS